MLEYRDLSPLQVRIDTHRRHSERVDDVEADVTAAVGYTAAADLLDVGCGTGAYLRRLATEHHGHPGHWHPGHGVLAGVDTSPAAVAAAGAVPGVDARAGDAAALPFGDAVFDVVTARHMLYHVAEPVAAVREARRVLRPGGRFAAVVNIAGAYPRIAALIGDAIEAHGFDRDHYTVSVDGDNVADLVASVFARTGVQRHDSALVFTAPGPVVAYAVSMLAGYGVPDGDPRRPAVVDRIRVDAARWFAGGATVRDPKGYVIVTGS